ncbi:sugar-transfer associated ATP-grasp domain-containing protein [Aquicoccus sp. SU-CL01552]|uniref:sugar-transfer associated ATP-grasp domain-containing protein n=1 Tax=Aquicoccus sp. SU-CL01552 TaxID=3127656 RepID=UPI003109AF3B
MTAIEPQALLAPPLKPQPAPASKIVEVARRYHVSPLRQLREMIALNLGPGRLDQHEYYDSGLYNPDLSREEKRAFVGKVSSWKLNRRLSPFQLTDMRPFVANKAMFTALIRQLGFRTTTTQAIVSSARRFGNIPTLASEDELRRFLMDEADFPLFGKPEDFSGSYGSARLDRIEGQDVVLGDGRRIALDAFCNEILAGYGEGYLLQSALEQHQMLSEIAGISIGTIRVVTVRQDNVPEQLYALWKVPSPEAMSDNFWQSGSMIAPVSVDKGVVGTCRIGAGLEAQDIERHPVSGLPFKGTQIPFWDEICRVTCEAHALFLEFGVIGWDVAITPEGPALIECNANPFHTLYQNANGRGIRNPEFEPVFDRVAAFSERMLDEKKAAGRAREKAMNRKGER